MNTANEIIKEGNTTTERALILFDKLEIADLGFMLGRWKGTGLHTNHPMDGLLEAYNWYGKEFIDPDNVHPLLFLDRKNHIFRVNPRWIPLKLLVHFTMSRNKITKRVFLAMKWFLKTDKTTAKIRMMEYRGKVSATMIYDNLPVRDIFRKIDNNTLLGMMDLKGIDQPFFFILKRENNSQQNRQKYPDAEQKQEEPRTSRVM
ncbi:MAG: DUF4334 domain-containing protein [Candidatus Brocadiaceae bacterium]|nr:DUF4334 domain-containing protein [Candidatus Brocadiaceae bacterium]